MIWSFDSVEAVQEMAKDIANQFACIIVTSDVTAHGIYYLYPFVFSDLRNRAGW